MQVYINGVSFLLQFYILFLDELWCITKFLLFSSDKMKSAAIRRGWVVILFLLCSVLRKVDQIMKNVKNNKSGFSLVELIVVLVIMAILVAALVPSLIGYINQARQSTAKDEASAIVQAAQTIVSSAYADPDSTYYDESGNSWDVAFTDFTGELSNIIDTDAKSALESVLQYLSEIDFTYTSTSDDDVSTISTLYITAGVVSSLEYTASNGETISYSDGTYTSVESSDE